MLFVVFSQTLYAQSHNSVPLDDEVYPILELAQIRNQCEQLITTRPYSLKTVLGALDQISKSEFSTQEEKDIALRHMERLTPQIHEPWYMDLTFRHESEGELLNNIEVGGKVESEMSTNLNEPQFGGDVWLTAFIRGDLSKYFSYNFNIGISVGHPAFATREPYTFTQGWDGYRYDFEFDFMSLTDEPGFGARFLPELSLGFWDGKVGINFSRIRRDWGIGDGNLMLSASASPFMAVDLYFHPVSWLNISMIAGTTEFLRTSEGEKKSAWDFQNNYVASTIELFLGKWVYLALNSSVILPKRMELGYLNPGYFQFFYQNLIGDFDNMQIGISLGLNVPKYLRAYFNIFLDEVNLQSSDFFHRERNIFSWQTGLRSHIPGLPFSSLIVQYTKIEPYMYTHAPTEVPWYSHPVNTSYTSHGEGIGYPLFPNSDELKVKFTAMPFWFLTTEAQFRMLRHGLTTGGSTFTEVWTYDDLDKKDFLRDGAYEWIYSLGISAQYNMRHIGVPITVGVSYVFYYRNLTDFPNSGFSPVDKVVHNGQVYESGCNNLISLSVKIW